MTAITTHAEVLECIAEMLQLARKRAAELALVQLQLDSATWTVTR